MKPMLLDCTLRDGAYIVDSRFGDSAIRGIIAKLEEAGLKPGRDVMLSVARRDGLSELFTLGEGDDAHAVG